jgi:tRNA A37 threonylcarbamoyladenosine dehydratase
MNQEPPTRLTPEYWQRFSSVARLYGHAALERLQAAHVAVIGVGGVGSWTVESLARSGVGQITLVDLDDVCITNTGRQLPALQSTVGRPKIEVLAERIHAINPECQVNPVAKFFVEATVEEILRLSYSCVVDAIDRFSTKTLLIGECHRRQIPVVTCGAGGGRRDPTRIRVADLAESSQDILLQQVRRGLRDKYDFPKGRSTRFGIPCVYSLESPVYYWPDGLVRPEPPPQEADRKLDCSQGYGAATHVTGIIGFMAAAEAVKLVLGVSKLEGASPDAP